MPEAKLTEGPPTSHRAVLVGRMDASCNDPGRALRDFRPRGSPQNETAALSRPRGQGTCRGTEFVSAAPMFSLAIDAYAVALAAAEDVYQILNTAAELRADHLVLRSRDVLLLRGRVRRPRVGPTRPRLR